MLRPSQSKGCVTKYLRDDGSFFVTQAPFYFGERRFFSPLQGGLDSKFEGYRKVFW
jgi:hypothetical protein